MPAEVIQLKRKKDPAFEPYLDAKGIPVPQYFVHLPSGNIYYRETFKKEGLPALFKSTGEKTIGRARTRAELMVQRHRNKHLGVDDSQVFGRQKGKGEKTVRDVGSWVLENYTPTQRIGTQNNHKLFIGQLIDCLGPRSINSLGPETLDEMIRWVKHRGLTQNAKRRREGMKPRAPRRTFDDYAKNLNLLTRHAYNPRGATHLVGFMGKDSKKTTGRLLKRSEVNALWKVMDEDTRDQYVLCLECIMRKREAICAPWSELSLKTGEWTLPPERVKTGSKTGKGRSFILSPHALKRMRARRERMNGSSPWIFPSPKGPKEKPIWSIKTAWKSAKKRAKIKGRCRWHDLRHTALSWALLGDPDATPVERAAMIREPLEVSEYAGVSIRTIQSVYLKSKASQTRSVGRAIRILDDEEEE